MLIAAPTAQAASETTAPEENHGAERKGAAFLDPLGFVIFGPTIGAEYGPNHLAGLVYGRWFDAGYLSNSMFIEDDDNESFAFSYGVGMRARYYPKATLAGGHLGLGLEYLTTSLESQANLTAVNNHLLVPHAEGGYRYSLDGFFVGGAALLGYAIQVSSSVDNIKGGTSAHLYKPDDVSTLYASASLEIGAYF